MNVTIDLVADAASMVWGERSSGTSRTVDVPGRGVRLLLSARGDVVGVEVLGWSERIADPSPRGRLPTTRPGAVTRSPSCQA